ncbi:hypothetical protein [Bacillus sp. 1P06AnD]|uniref:hypothetical protein n=1 Tax=Bacillus sp. 1P06AnD TaxID=3132208 RepID=UPI00399F9BF2
MNNKPYCIAVYSVNDYSVVRKCCSPGYTWHAIDEAVIDKLPQCTCEIVATKLTKETALELGQKLSNQLDVPFINQ